MSDPLCSRDLRGKYSYLTLVGCTLPIFLVVGAVLANYWDGMVALVNEWRVNDTFSFGFLIVPISLFLVWEKRDKMAGEVSRPSFLWGTILLLAGLSLLVLGDAGRIIALVQISLIPTLAGIVLLVLGWRLLSVLWFPIVYLLLGIPVWDILTEKVHLPFQLFSAWVGASLLKLFGVPAFLDGVSVSLPGITLMVERVCSGVNYLIAVVAIGIALAYLFIDRWLKRFLLIFSAVIIAIVSNGLRVTFIGLCAHFGIGDTTHGPFHIFQGLFVSTIGYVVLLVGLWILSDKKPRKRLPLLAEERSCLVFESGLLPTRRRKFGAAVCLTLFLLVGTWFYRANMESVAVPPGSELKHFPFTTGKWLGQERPVTIPEIDGLGASEYLARDYRSSYGDLAGIRIAYFESQEQGMELVGYRTRGLHYEAREVTKIVPGYGPVIVNSLSIEGRAGSRNILFWYDIGGKPFTGRLQAKLVTTLAALRSRGTNGSLVLLFHDSSDSRLPTEDKVLEDFFRSVYPLLRERLS